MKMTILERINRFCDKYPEPVQYGFFLKWNRADGVHRVLIGDPSQMLMKWRSPLTCNTGSPYYAAHYRYDEETELFECAYIVVKRTVLTSGENRRWKYAERYFIPKEKKVLYCQDGYVGPYLQRWSYGNYEVCEPKNFFQCLQRKDTKNELFLDAFLKVTDNDPDLPPRFARKDNTYYPWVMTEWIVHKRKENKGKGLAQKKINQMLERELCDEQPIFDCILNFIGTDNNTGYSHYSYNRIFAYFDKNAKVFRVFFRPSSDATTFNETERIYLDKNGKTVITKNNYGEWVPNGSFTISQFGVKVVNIDDLFDTDNYAYMKKMDCKKMTLYGIIKIIRTQEVEQFVNMDCVGIANQILNSDSKFEGILNYIFGETESKSKSVCKRYGLTQKQMKVINDYKQEHYYGGYYYRRKTAIEAMKMFLGVDSLSSIDVDLFAKYYKAVKENDLNYNSFFCVNEEIDEHKRTQFKRLVNMCDTHENAFQIFNDTYRDYQRISLQNKPNIDFCSIRKYEDLVRIHDMIVEIVAIERAERERLNTLKEDKRNKEIEKKMKKLDEKRAELNYEDDDFIIRIPTHLSEITVEGGTLRHCVSGYKNNHAQGFTTIMFLRKKSAPTVPFYTIEVNNNKIKQIHGHGNKWLGNNPEAIPTVMRWLKKNGIKCSDEILASTAKGYCSNGAPLVALPVI